MWYHGHMTTTEHKPPTDITGTPVEVVGRATTLGGETWVTLVPTDDADPRMWEWSTTTGRLVLTSY